MPHSINQGDARFAYFNKIWGIPALTCDKWIRSLTQTVEKYHNTALEAGRHHLLRRHSLGNQQWQP